MTLPRFFSVGECMVEMSPHDAPGTYRMAFAGDTLNTAWYVRQLLRSDGDVSYLTATGDDDVSARMRAFMEEAGISTRFIGREAKRTVGLYMIHLKDGERSFSYWRGQSAAKNLVQHLPDAATTFAAGDIVHFSGITLAITNVDERDGLLAFMQDARQARARVSFDPNIRQALWQGRDEIHTWIRRAAGVADILFPSLDEEMANFDDADAGATADRYLGWGAKQIVVKNGSGEGLLANVDGDRQAFQPEHVANVVDTTAAGDSFNAGYIAAMLAGEDAKACARLGARTAAIVVQHKGALIDPALLASEKLNAKA